ncbi:RagB/SusD family nutrient uptake outer membrane protein [Gramella jeungdoensis]|uniref:RagB/SusD family nutrient uptake outer membrane protein n=1 Tax=Gramella jeungdoensis TaxID=708091 RepID=A0ABT0Z562_9FLAO|nr:RagB/SusD family nutrient uptake outer membrane protein [Gramella jeungdoensis]MCM8570297.1 RagB/SusD family nutrient uptake outer membrane protein [Gramella jeungdoensis]
MKFNYKISYSIWLILPLLFISCEDFVEVEAPDNKLVSDVVFNNDATAESAMTGIYNQLFLADFSSGQRTSVTFLSGLSADNFQNIRSSNITRMEFEQHEITPDNPGNLDIWASAYNIIYLTNSLLEGLNNSEQLSSELKTQLEGEARFIRAFSYFYLVNLYGDVPLIVSTNYHDNQLASRTSSAEVYEQIISDLEIALDSLSSEYKNGERTTVNKFAAASLLARVHLYLEDWGAAERLSSEVIDQNETYEILEDLDQVFLANSKEAIWQISPLGGGGQITNTNEGSLFIIDPIFSFFAVIKMEEGFVEQFDQEDQRLSNWIGYNEELDAYFPFKYKVWSSNELPILEYSMVLRLAEQYLIRSEARAKQGDLIGAIEDLDVIRIRAGIASVEESNPGIGEEALLDLIMKERQKELFAEWSHRWLDLKRTDRANDVFGSNPMWDPTDILYPIPSQEREKNLNLSQNPGY